VANKAFRGLLFVIAAARVSINAHVYSIIAWKYKSYTLHTYIPTTKHQTNQPTNKTRQTDKKNCTRKQDESM